MSDSDDFFGGGAKSASFHGQPGITWSGVIDRIGNKVQKREYNPNGIGALKFYPGTTDPIMQLPITLLTDARDPAVPNDDGRRVIYFEGTKRKALIDALKAAGKTGGPVLGDWMALEYYAQEQGKGVEPKKLYRAQYMINPNPQARGQFYVPSDADPATLAQPATPHVEQSRTVPAYAPGQPNFGNPNQPAAQASPFTNGAPQDNPANNWPPAGSIPAPAATAAPVQETQPQPVAAGAAGPVAMNRPWG